MSKKLAIIAIGGNALIKSAKHQTVEDQYLALCETMVHIADVIEQGWQVIVTHGNGPQVGFLLLRSEIARAEAGLHSLPLVTCVADTQGGIGYQVQQALNNELAKRKLPANTATIVTQVEVDANDPGLSNPDKFVGTFYSEEQLPEIKSQHPDWILKADSNRGYRRVVASPQPKTIVEMAQIKHLLAGDFTVVTVGGGGIPVVRNGTSLKGVDAVIDKDLASSLLANELKADLLVISTGVEQVAVNFGKPDEKKLGEIKASELEKYFQEGHFPAGSMGPKVRCAIDFINKGGKRVIITSPEAMRRAISEGHGTHVVA